MNGTAAQPVEFLFDYASPWSFLADSLLPRHFGDTPLAFVPVYLRGFESFSKGLPYTAAKLAYVMRDFERCAADAGVAVKMPPVFPINGVHALRGAIAAHREGKLAQYHEPMFRAAWTEGRDVSDRDVVGAIARELGLPSVAEALEEPSIKGELRANTEKAVARGVFGVPTFFVGGELFWGHDRMHLVVATARSGPRAPRHGAEGPRRGAPVTKEEAERFAHEWIDAWNSHDLRRILAHYADDFEMASPRIVDIGGEASGVLRGKEKVGAYWRKALDVIPDLRFELVAVFAGARSVAIHYRNQAGRMAVETFELGDHGRVTRAAAHYA